MIDNPISRSGMKNRLKLFGPEGELRVDATCECADITLEQAHQIFKVKFAPKGISPRLVARLRELATCLEFVAETFGGNSKQTRFWWKTPNPEFGGLSPHELLLLRRYEKVFAFVLAARNQLETRKKS